MTIGYWLMKSEPSVYGWSDLVRDKKTSWSGVRNYLANNNMKAMKLGDQAFFYHSNDDRAILGVMTIVHVWQHDPSDPTGRFGMVDVASLHALKNPITLREIKESPRLKSMQLLRLSRLSVSAVTKEEWKLISSGAL